jgi:hypothetical protein
MLVDFNSSTARGLWFTAVKWHSVRRWCPCSDCLTAENLENAAKIKGIYSSCSSWHVVGFPPTLQFEASLTRAYERLTERDSCHGCAVLDHHHAALTWFFLTSTYSRNCRNIREITPIVRRRSQASAEDVFSSKSCTVLSWRTHGTTWKLAEVCGKQKRLYWEITEDKCFFNSE